jgi:DNA-binding response OmpR family regulator
VKIAATVLVVDDDPGTVMTFAYALRTTGCRVLTASTGTEAIRQVGLATPDLVLCDLSLPDISGIDVCRALRKASVAAAFVIVTGFASVSTAFEAGQYGATGFIEKPVDVDDLVAVVEEQLREQHGKTAPLGLRSPDDADHARHRARLRRSTTERQHDEGHRPTATAHYLTGGPATDTGCQPETDWSKQYLCAVFVLFVVRRLPVMSRKAAVNKNDAPASIVIRLHVTSAMATTRSTKSNSRDKVRAHRERLRRRGLRPIQIWVPDVRSRTFVREARRQARLVAASPFEIEEQAFVDSISEWNPE